MIHESVFRRVKFSKSVISLGEFYKYVKQYYEKHSRLMLTREIFSKMSVINHLSKNNTHLMSMESSIVYKYIYIHICIHVFIYIHLCIF